MARDIGQHKPLSIGKQHGGKRIRDKRADERRGTAQARGYDARWRRFRNAFLSRHPLCEYCKAQGRVVAASVVDHDLPHRGDTDLFWRNTYTALCKPCHDGPKARAEARLDGEALLAWVRARKAGSGAHSAAQRT